MPNIKKIEAYVTSGGDISGNPNDDSIRVTFIKSGYQNVWIAIVEDYAFSITSKYLTADGIEKLGLGELNKKEKASDQERVRRTEKPKRRKRAIKVKKSTTTKRANTSKKTGG